jgi:hypothetical protein
MIGPVKSAATVGLAGPKLHPNWSAVDGPS